MPVENTAMNIGIRPTSGPQRTGSTDGVNRREDGSGSSQAFSPKTNVSIKSAVNDMAGILAKISTNQSESVEKMPETIQKLVQNVMKEAFSLNETLAKGLGSTLESQRFSLDQLTSLSRMLSQLGTLAEKGLPAGASDELQALLTNLKGALSAEGTSLEPVLITKAAFELLDGKSVSELPQEMQQLLAALRPQGQTVSYASANSSSLGFLKQLVEYMMPRPASTAASAQTAGNAPQGNALPGSTAQSGTPLPQGSAIQSANAQPQGGTTQTTNIATPQAGATQNANMLAQTTVQNMPQNGTAPQAETTMPGQQAAVQGQTGIQSQTAGLSQNAMQPQVQGQSVAQSPNVSPQGNTAGAQIGGQSVQAMTNGAGSATLPSNAAGQPVASQQLAGQPTMPGQTPAGQAMRSGQNTSQAAPLNSTQTARQTKQELMSQTIVNTPEALQAMRGAASNLLTSTNITEGDALLLQSFINGKEQLLNAKETRELQQLVRLCQQNIPATVQQAAQQQNLPDLPRLWAFMQLCDMAGADTKKMSARTLKKAGKDIASFVIGMRASLTGDNTSAIQGQRSLNFMLPMYMDDVTYPAYIHVYDEEKQDELTGELKKETWLRLCVLTDNIGAVELTCRVYGEQLDMRVVFSDSEAARDFRENAAELKTELKDSPLKLNDFKIGAPGNAESV